jgi:HJR/Mrr/RecB family endonuclease
MGYRNEITSYVGDCGVDLVTSKDGVKTFIQARRYKSKAGVKAIKDAVVAEGYCDCTKAMAVEKLSLAKEIFYQLWPLA